MTENLQQKNDEKFINIAINLAYKKLIKTSPNPRVGTVIVKNNKIISTAVTSTNGRPHSEINAINQIKDKTLLSGATIYLSLEPCCFYPGKTSPSCVDEIIRHKFSRVVIANIDPNLNINGKSLSILEKSGIETKIINSNHKIHQDFFKIKKTGLPFITLKIATSLDGKIATKNFSSQWITNEKSRKFSHLLRAQNDGILIGASTLRYDNPKLNCRIEGLEQYSPKKIIVSQSLEFSKDLAVFNGLSPTIIVTNESNKANEKIKNFNATIIFCSKQDSNDSKINLHDALKQLANLGINSILVEGGSSIISQLLKLDLIDKIIWARSNLIIGNDGISAVDNLNIADINQAIKNYHRTDLLEFGSDIIEILEKNIL